MWTALISHIPLVPQPEPHAAVVVGARRQLLGGIQTVHRDDERARERTVLVGQANRKILTGPQARTDSARRRARA